MGIQKPHDAMSMQTMRDLESIVDDVKRAMIEKILEDRALSLPDICANYRYLHLGTEIHASGEIFIRVRKVGHTEIHILRVAFE